MEELKAELKRRGKKTIGDGEYSGHQDEIITPNPHGSRALKRFKARALKRHEKFNGLIKKLSALAAGFLTVKAVSRTVSRLYSYFARIKSKMALRFFAYSSMGVQRH
jgi:hypothetical protein